MSVQKLTEPQEKALNWLSKNDGSRCYWHRFGTMEALRRRGLAARLTSYLIKAEYAEKSTVNLQFEAPATKPLVVHEWYITNAGIAALRSRDGGRG